MSERPEPELYLDWVDLCRWFRKTYPKQFKEEAVRDWIVGGSDYISNGSLVTASGECLLDPDLEEGEEDTYEMPPDAVVFFMKTLKDEWPKAFNEYGDVKIYFWW